MPLPEDIITKVRRDFSEDDSLHVLQLLAGLQQEDSDLFSDRILRCIVVTGRGVVENIIYAVKLARVDWRDLIMYTEYERGNCVRLLSLPFGIHPEAGVLKQWLAGQTILVPAAAGQGENWTIEVSEIREWPLVQVHPLSKASPEVVDPNLYFAVMRFLCVRGYKEISDSNAFETKAFIQYCIHPDTGEFEFQKFWYQPQDVKKRGKW